MRLAIGILVVILFAMDMRDYISRGCVHLAGIGTFCGVGGLIFSCVVWITIILGLSFIWKGKKEADVE